MAMQWCNTVWFHRRTVGHALGGAANHGLPKLARRIPLPLGGKMLRAWEQQAPVGPRPGRAFSAALLLCCWLPWATATIHQAAFSRPSTAGIFTEKRKEKTLGSPSEVLCY
jgi:hypothetical protein